MRVFRTLTAGLFCSLTLGAGCASSYTVPGGPANLSAMRSSAGLGERSSIRVGDAAPTPSTEPEPMARFPAMVAVARVQASGYRSRTAQAYGNGAYSVITTRDVEGDDTFARIAKLPGIVGIAQMNRLLLPPTLQTEADLRAAAGRLKADVLVIYTFDTDFYDRDYAAPLSVVTLGLSPNKRAFVTTTATALIVDARSGFVYGGAEATQKSDQAANSWTTDDAIDDARQRTERRAFEKLVGELEKTWPNIVSQYGGAPASAPAR